MFELTTPFIISQILVGLAMISDFLSFQFKKREHILIFFCVSASLISVHYFLLNKIAAAVFIFFSVLRFIISYFTTNTKVLYFFIFLNCISLFFTYQELYDFILFIALNIAIFASFQKNDQKMRQFFMIGTSGVILYNITIFTPVGIIMETSFLLSNFIGYYRYYLRKT